MPSSATSSCDRGCAANPYKDIFAKIKSVWGKDSEEQKRAWFVADGTWLFAASPGGVIIGADLDPTAPWLR